MRQNIPALVRRARNVSTPIIAISTPDPAATETAITAETGEAPALRWDSARGITPVNNEGGEALSTLSTTANEIVYPEQALKEAAQLPPDSILFFYMAHRYIEGPGSDGTIQALWNLRDEYKKDGRTVILLGPAFSLPADIANDILPLEESYPEEEEIKKIVLTQYDNTRKTSEGELTTENYPDPDSEQMDKTVDALRGLAAYPIEQTTAMALRKSGIDQEDLIRRKKAQIGNVDGLSVHEGAATFDNAGGLDTVKELFTDLFNGPTRPRVLVWIDEIEKLLAGAQGDTSGVSQDQLATILTLMEINEWGGLLAVGHPGTGKSLIARTAAKTFDTLCIRFDTGATKGSLVGESEKKIRQAFKTLYAIGQERVFIVGTCNALGSITPALQRRFGTPWYFEIPTREEQDAIWPISLAKYGLDPDQTKPDYTEWTGAEITKVCDWSYRLNQTLIRAADKVIPIAKSDPDSIARLRLQANGHWLSASYPGLFDGCFCCVALG